MKNPYVLITDILKDLKTDGTLKYLEKDKLYEICAQVKIRDPFLPAASLSCYDQTCRSFVVETKLVVQAASTQRLCFLLSD
jgi:hypothetical protein